MDGIVVSDRCLLKLRPRKYRARLHVGARLKWLAGLLVDLEVGTKWSAVSDAWVAIRPNWLKRIAEIRTFADLCRVCQFEAVV